MGVPDPVQEGVGVGVAFSAAAQAGAAAPSSNIWLVCLTNKPQKRHVSVNKNTCPPHTFNYQRCMPSLVVNEPSNPFPRVCFACLRHSSFRVSGWCTTIGMLQQATEGHQNLHSCQPSDLVQTKKGKFCS